MNKKVLIAAPVHPVLVQGLHAAGYSCKVHEKITQELGMALVADCVGIVTSTRLQIDKTMIDAAPDLQWIGRMGSGMEVIDLDYALARSIACYSSPEGNRNAVAEHALGMLLALNKKLVKSCNEVKHGIWLRDENRGVELDGKTIGIIGFGNTGNAFARKLGGFDVKILAFDKYKTQFFSEHITQCNGIETIFEHADIVSFHVPLQEDTVHYFNNWFVDSMKKPFVLINTSRGRIVDTKAVFDGLMSSKISGVCLDVWEEEPFDMMSETMKDYLHKISNMPQAIITPHIAGYSNEALYKMSKILLDRIVMPQ